MSIDGASHPFASFSWPSHARRSSTTWLKICVSKLHQTLGLPCKSTICMHSYDLPDLHASILHLSIYPGVRSTSRADRFPWQNGFFTAISSKKCKPCAQPLTTANSSQEEEPVDLESEILEFMDNSERPKLFPSRSQLMEAGRSDLVEAILAKGGWMVAGWDMEPSTGEQIQKCADSHVEKATGEANAGVSGVQNRQPTGLRAIVDNLDLDEFATNSNIEVGQCARAVSSLERQRGWEKVADLFGLSSVTKPEHGERPLGLVTQGIPKKRPNANGISQSDAQVQFVDVISGSSRDNSFQPLAGGNQCSDITAQAVGEKRRRRQKSARNGRAGLPTNESVGSAKKKAPRRDCCFSKSKTSHMKFDEQQGDLKDMSPLSHRILGLEAELVSTLDSLKSGRQALNTDITIKQRHSIALTELEEVSDALEFCETEIMNKNRELRTARAQRIAFEGKLALELMEFKKDMEEKDKRLEGGMQVLKMLRTARIVWANPASEVFLAGSFDGWASWTRMEKSSAGVFVTALQLYPGQYEIKFIVNGEWRVDPNRPVIWANGFENNALTIL